MRKGNVGRKTMVWRNVCFLLPYTSYFVAMRTKVKQLTNYEQLHYIFEILFLRDLT